MKKLLSEDYKDEIVPKNSAEFAPVDYQKSVSLDRSIDTYFKKYEREAVNGQHPMQENWKIGFQKLLKEAPEDAGGLGGGDMGLGAPGGDMGGLGGDMGMGDEQAAEKKSGPSILPPNIDTERFAELVYGLMQNYESLLDPKTVILNRAEEYLARNYSPRHAEKLRTFIETQFGVGFNQRAANMPDTYTVGATGGGDLGGGGPPA